MLPTRKRQRQIDLLQDLTLENKEEQPSPKRVRSAGWFSSKVGGLVGRVYQAMRKLVHAQPPEDERGNTEVDEEEAISSYLVQSPASALERDIALLNINGKVSPAQEVLHGGGGGPAGRLDLEEETLHRNLSSTPDLSSSVHTPSIGGGGGRGGVRVSKQGVATPLFSNIERRNHSSQYSCVLSTWAKAKQPQPHPRSSASPLLQPLSRSTPQQQHLNRPPWELTPQSVPTTSSSSLTPTVDLWSSDYSGWRSSSHLSSLKHGKDEGRLKASYSSGEPLGLNSSEKRKEMTEDPTVQRVASLQIVGSPRWTRPVPHPHFFHSSVLRTSQYEQLQTMFLELKNDMVSSRKDFEAQRTALETIVTLAREEREQYVDDSAKRVLRGPQAENMEEEMNLSLSTSQENTIREVWRYGNEDDAYSTAFSIVMKRCDLHTLAPSTWLNDSVINFYLNLVCQRNQETGFPCRAHCMRTFFYPKLLSAGYAGVRRWTKKVDIFKDFDIVLIPVHLGVHWTLAVLDFKNKKAVYYDSLLGTNQVCLAALLDWLVGEAKDKKGINYSVKDWKRSTPKDIPRQKNSSDCGVFTCMFARYYARNRPFTFTQDDMPGIRKKMVCEIIEKRLY